MSDDNDKIPRTRPTRNNPARFHQGNVTVQEVGTSTLRVGDWVMHQAAPWCFYEIVRIETRPDASIDLHDADGYALTSRPDFPRDRLTGFAPGVANINLK